MSDQPQRRAEDPRIQQLVDDVAEAKERQGVMERKLDENTRITTEMKITVEAVKDILTSFRVLKTVAVWLSSIAAAVGATWAAIRQIKGGG